MRKIIGLVVILAALVLGSYYGMGFVTERTLKRDLEMVNQSNGLFVDIANYKRGWLKSTAMLKWRIHVPQKMIKNQDGQSTILVAKDYNVEMPLVIHHGPIIFADKSLMFGLGYASTDIALPDAYKAEIDSNYIAQPAKPHMLVSVFVNYLNQSRLRMHVPQFKLIAKQGQQDQIEFKGITSDVNISSKRNRIDGDFVIEGITLVKNNLKLSLDSVNTDYNLHRSHQGLYLGVARLKLPSMQVTQNEKIMFAVDKLDIQSDSDINDGLFNSNLNVGFDKLINQNKQYNRGRLAVSIKKIDAEVLARVNQQLSSMQQNSETDRQHLLLSLLPELPRLVSKGAEFEVSDFHVAMSEGDVKANLRLVLPSENSGNPFQLVQKIHGQGHLSIASGLLKSLIQESIKKKLIAAINVQQAIAQPQADAAAQSTTPLVSPTDVNQQAASQANEKIAAMIKSGLLVSQGSDYNVDLELSQGKLMVNGKAFNAEMMQI